MASTLEVHLADLQYIRAEFSRNEEIGEKRFGFFVTLVTAVTGGLFAVATSDGGDTVKGLANVIGLAAIVVFGILTYLRLLRRNYIADHLKYMSREVRDRALSVFPEIDLHAEKLRWPRPDDPMRWIRAGYAQVVGGITGALLGAFLWVATGCTWAGVVAGVTAAAALWVFAVKWREHQRAQIEKGFLRHA